MGVEEKQLGFRAAYGKKSKFEFSAAHDRKIISAAVNKENARGLMQAIGCTVTQLDARREALKRYGFLIKLADGSYVAGAGVKVLKPQAAAVKQSAANNPRGAAGNNAKEARQGQFFDRPDKKAPDPAVDLQTGGAVTMENVRDGQCRWPKEGSREFQLCGRKAIGVYCEYHTGRGRGQRQPTHAA